MSTGISTKQRISIGIAGVVLGLVAALTLPSLGDSTSTSTDRTVTVTGTSTIKAKPDEAVVTLGVQTQASSADAAMRENATKVNALIAALANMGIKGSDVSTSGVSLYPTYGANGNDITGYNASNQLAITVKDVGSTGKVIDAAVRAGANTLDGVEFKLSDQNTGMSDALTAAVADAKSKAETLASAGGAQLGGVLRITENASPSTQPPVFAAAEAVSAPTPIQPPTLETQVSVTVVWSLV